MNVCTSVSAEIWGPLFIPAYLAASLTAVLRGRHFYFDNAFEVEAFGPETAQLPGYLSLISRSLNRALWPDVRQRPRPPKLGGNWDEPSVRRASQPHSDPH